MFRVFGVVLVVIALAVAVIPAFTDCQSQGQAIVLANGKTIPMKCHWTAQAEIAAAVPIMAVGAMLTRSRRKESVATLSIMGTILGIFVVLLPTALIGVCQTNMLCNTVMKPTLLSLGSIVTAVSVVGLVVSQRQKEI